MKKKSKEFQTNYKKSKKPHKLERLWKTTKKPNSKGNTTFFNDFATRKVAVKDCISVLGVDYAAGKNITYTKMKERLCSARKKATKIMSFTKGG